MVSELLHFNAQALTVHHSMDGNFLYSGFLNVLRDECITVYNKTESLFDLVNKVPTLFQAF